MTKGADLYESLSRSRIRRYWLPLEATWLMMAAEGPFLAAVIARLAGAKENLAAFGVATAMAWIVESPIIMILSASNALVRDKVAYRKLRRFSFTLNGLVTAAMAVMVAPPVFGFIARNIIGLSPDVAKLAGRAVIFLVLWPGAIGFRRFYQGLMIRFGRPQAVTWGTIIRLSTMTATGLVLALALHWPGASVGAGALGAGVLAEGAASWAMARPTVRSLRRQPDAECSFGRGLTTIDVARFYVPLALTSFLTFFINPLTTFFLARGRFPLESLAVLPVIVSLAFIFRTAGIAMQEVVIALLDGKEKNRPALGRFCLVIGLSSSAALALVSLTPVAAFWYRTVSGLPADLAAFALWPGGLLVFLPLLETGLAYYRGVLVKAHRTAPIGLSVAVQLAVTTAVFSFVIFGTRMSGALSVGVALTAGYAAGNAALFFVSRKPAAAPAG